MREIVIFIAVLFGVFIVVGILLKIFIKRPLSEIITDIIANLF